MNRMGCAGILVKRVSSAARCFLYVLVRFLLANKSYMQSCMPIEDFRGLRGGRDRVLNSYMHAHRGFQGAPWGPGWSSEPEGLRQNPCKTCIKRRTLVFLYTSGLCTGQHTTGNRVPCRFGRVFQPQKFATGFIYYYTPHAKHLAYRGFQLAPSCALYSLQGVGIKS